MDSGDLVRSIVLAQNRGDDDTLLEALHPEIEWHQAATETDTAPVLVGRDALLRAVGQGREEAGDLRITMHEVEQAGDEVLVIGTVAGSRGMRMPRAWIWEVRDGRAVRVESYTGRAPAVRAWNARRSGD